MIPVYSTGAAAVIDERTVDLIEVATGLKYYLQLARCLFCSFEFHFIFQRPFHEIDNLQMSQTMRFVWNVLHFSRIPETGEKKISLQNHHQMNLVVVSCLMITLAATTMTMTNIKL